MFSFRSKDNKETSSASSVSSKSTTPIKKLIERFTPFEDPINPLKPPVFDLTEEQQIQYDEVYEYFVGLDGVATSETDETVKPFSVHEKSWLTKECFLRYLRATKWNTKAAIKRLEETLVWRRTFGISGENNVITADLVSVENETGKNLILGYDNDNRPCMYLRNGYQNTKPSIKQVYHLVFMLERVIQYMPAGQDTLALLIDFKASDLPNTNSKFPPISITKQCLHILQHHYPERLGKGLFTNIPWIGYTFLKLAGPFIDPYTRSKTIYDQPFENFVPAEQLDKEFNGMLDFKYDHNIYWPKMNEIADQRQEKYMKNFAKLGEKIGLSEYDLKQVHTE